MSYVIFGKDQLCPLALLLATSGSGGNKLLIRYPSKTQKSLYELFDTTEVTNVVEDDNDLNTQSLDAFVSSASDENSGRVSVDQDTAGDTFDFLRPLSYIENDMLSPELKDDVLVSLLVAKDGLDVERFFLKLEDVIFVGHCSSHDKFTIGHTNPARTIKYFNVCFALKSNTNKDVQNSYYLLAKAIANGICFEECRSNFLTTEREAIQTLSDELQGLAESGESAAVAATPSSIGEHNSVIVTAVTATTTTTAATTATTSCDSQDPIHTLFGRSQLCADLKAIVDDVARSGFTNSRINNFPLIHMCIRQRVYHVVDNVYVSAVHVKKQCAKIKPFHTLIFLEPYETVYANIDDSNIQFLRFMEQITISKTIAGAASDAGLRLSFCLKMARSLVCWGKALPVCPIQDTNRYWLAPYCNLVVSADLLAQFHERFPALYLPHLIRELNRYQTWRDVLDRLAVSPPSADDDDGSALIEWLLRKRLVYQVHRYFVVLPAKKVVCLAARLPASSFSDEETRARFAKLVTEHSLSWWDFDPSLSVGVLLSTASIAGEDIDGMLDSEAVSLLGRLLPLCDGRCHLEEMENLLSQQQQHTEHKLDVSLVAIETVLTQLGTMLVRFDTADPITSCYAGLA